MCPIHTYADINSIVTTDLKAKEEGLGSEPEEYQKRHTSRETLRIRIIDTITHRKTTMTIEFIRLNQWMRGSNI